METVLLFTSVIRELFVPMLALFVLIGCFIMLCVLLAKLYEHFDRYHLDGSRKVKSYRKYR